MGHFEKVGRRNPGNISEAEKLRNAVFSEGNWALWFRSNS